MASNVPYSRRELLIRFSSLALASRLNGTLRAQDASALHSVDDHIRRLASDAPLSMQFRGRSSGECSRWQAEFAARLRSLLGPHQPPKLWKTTVIGTTELEDHRREEVELAAEGCPPLPLYLLVPRGAGKPRPGVLALHGHGEFGHHAVAGRDDLPGVLAVIQRENYDYGRQLVRRGYVVAVPCLTPFGVRLGKREIYEGEDPCAVTFVRLMLLGKLLISENLRDALWALELLARDGRVDSKRLACVGLSYGGRMTMLTAAIEPRVRVAVVSGALNLMQERISASYSCGAQVIPGLLQYGDTPEIASLIAPRPCLWEIGTDDKLIPAERAEDALVRMRRAYKAWDAEDRLLVDRFKGGHRWNGEAAYRLLESRLG